MKATMVLSTAEVVEAVTEWLNIHLLSYPPKLMVTEVERKGGSYGNAELTVTLEEIKEEVKEET